MSKIFTNASDKKEIVGKLVSLEKEQEKLFSMFENEIKSIQDGPFYTGLTYLEEAALDHQKNKDEIKMLNSALEEFRKAYGIQRAKLNKKAFDVHFTGFIQSYISITYLMLNSQMDALNWMEQSIVSLKEGQRLFASDIRGLEQEVESIEKNKWANGMFAIKNPFAAGLPFFFGNKSQTNNKQKLPEYKDLVLRYSLAQKESEIYLIEMTKLKARIENELNESSYDGKQLERKLTEMLNIATKKSKDTIEDSVQSLISDVKVSDVKGIFNKFKNNEKM